MNQELIDYIKQQMNLNVSKNKITDVLLGQGWQQAELDEAFSAAEGAPVSLRFSSGDPAGSQIDDSENGEISGSNRKTIIIAASVLVAVAMLAGIIILPLTGGKKDDPGKVADDPKSTEVDKPAVTETDAQKEERLAAEKAAVDRAELASAAKELVGLITPPAGWTSRAGIMDSRPLAAFFKPTKEKDDTGKEILTESITITRESIKPIGVSNIDDYFAKSKDAIKSDIPDYKITAERKVNLGDSSQAILAGATFTDGGIALRNMQLVALKGDQVYVVTGVVLGSNWESEKDMLGAAVMSFKYPVQN
jgi:flagellar basal body-associated protein FliL